MDNYSFEPVGAVDPTAAPVMVELVPPTSPPESYYNEEPETPTDTAIMVGCGVVGCIVGGPMLALLTALGGKIAADKSQGPIGDTSRALGRIASTAGKKAKEERLICKFKAAVRSLFAKKECKNCNCSQNGSASASTAK